MPLTQSYWWWDMMNDARRAAFHYGEIGRISVRGVRAPSGRWVYWIHLDGVRLDRVLYGGIRFGFRS